MYHCTCTIIILLILFLIKDIIEGSTLGAALKYLLENTSLTVAMAADSNQSVAMTKVAMDLLQKAVTNGSEDDDVTKLYSIMREC